MEKQYKALKSFTKYDYVIAHQKYYKWSSYRDSCLEFQSDMNHLEEFKEWARDGIYHINRELSDNFYIHAVKFGFMEKVVEEYYRIGDTFTHVDSSLPDNNVWKLNLYDNDLVGLNNENGLRWSKPLKTATINKIPASDFHRHFGKNLIRKK